METVIGSEAAVRCRAIVKRYGELEALRGVDLEVPAGAFFGLLGPNGAGKTTLVSILCTLRRPTSGEARLLGHDVLRERAAVRRLLGIVFQEPCLDTELTGRENLDIHARLYHVVDRERRVRHCLDLVGMLEHAERPVSALSGGLRRRLEIARGILHEPRVLFLDEPSAGLDVPSRHALWRHLLRVREEGRTTFVLCTHDMDEAARLCDELAILDGGCVAARGTPRALCQAVGGDRVGLELARAADAWPALLTLDGVLDGSREGSTIELRVGNAPALLPALVEVARPFGLRAVRMREANLEDAFLHFTGHAITAREEAG